MQTPQPDPGRIRLKPPAVILGLLALLLGWVFFLRWPTFSAPLWNVDESIHAAVARTLLDGGVLYRDAVDQRTPLTYYAVALLFRLFGENSLWAPRAAVALIIATTALGLFLLGRRPPGAAGGVWSALIFCALTTNLFDPGDGNAVNTEWFVIVFTTWGTWWFWRTQARTDLWSSALTGGLFGLAFLSKQPGLLDLAAPVLLLFYLAATGQKRPAEAIRSTAGILAGFLAITAVTLAYFAVRGAFSDLVFYTWTYNLRFYGPEVALPQRLLTASVPFILLFKQYPLVLLGLLGATMLQLVRLAQLRPTPEEKAGQSWALYLLLWSATSLAGAVSGGRGFEHYYIQCLPAFTLSTGWLLSSAGSFIRRRLSAADYPSRWAILAVVPVALFLGAVALSAVVSPMAGRGRGECPLDPALRSAKFIKTLTTPHERIFVWGYNPDIYLYTDRKPASRFMYCSFQTGLIPWTNLAPDKDTSYAIVPGAMKTLLAELAARRPTFIVDCSFGPHRHSSKYPIAKFAPLQEFVSSHYVVADPAQFEPQGFRLYLIKDSARHQPVPLAGGPPASRLAAPEVFGPPVVGPAPADFFVVSEDPNGRLQRLELRADGAAIDSVSFPPTGKITVRFAVPFDRLGAGKHRLTARTTAADGETRESTVSEVLCDTSSIPHEDLPTFALPCVSTAVTPLAIRAPFGPTAGWEGGHLVFFAHAPSTLSYPLGDGVVRVRGCFGFRPGAFAADNPAPTDGAEFFVAWVTPREERRVLFNRLLQPRDHPADRSGQFFTADLPPDATGGRIEFVITPGPSGNNACDWTYWSDLQLETSH
jgi:4-amino-4-deoxy-L-arabinose transferase-like glycosyltransferase